MYKVKSTKKLLLTSCLSLFLCLSMFIGTTFAWFTDSVTSANNIIKAGNLDVELEYATVTEGNLNGWRSVSGSSEVFDPNALWEPGRLEVVYLKVSNPGTLALKYKLTVNVYSEFAGENVFGETFKLSDYLVFKAVELETPILPFESREAAALMAGNVLGLKDYYGPEHSLKVGETDYVALIVYMPADVDNVANYRGSVVPEIQLGINLCATQVDFENDSFGPDYDEGLGFDNNDHATDLDDLRAEISAGGSITLDKDIVIDDNDKIISVEDKKLRVGLIIDKDTDIYLKDFDLSYLGSLDLDSLIYITNGAKVNFYGTTTAFLSSTDPTGSCTIIASHNSVVNIYGGAFTSKTVPVIELHSGATLNIHRGLFYSEGYRGEGISTDSLINLTEDSNSQINVFGGAFVNFDPSATKIGNLLADDHVVLKTVRNQGEVWHAVIHKDYSHYTPVYDIAEIKAAFESQADGIFLATDIEAEPNTESLMYGATSGSLNVLGNGSTIITRGTGTMPGAYDYGYVAFIPKKGCDATVTDLKVTGSGFFEIGDHGYGGGGKYTVENLVIEDLEATLFIENGGNYISPAFCHYGTATLTDCVMTGVTTQKTGYKPYDAGFVNGTKTFIEGGRYGSVYLSHQAHVTITGAVIDSIDSCAITTNNLGKLTLRAGTVVGTIRLTPGGYTPSIVIEEGAVVGSIIYNNVTYTLEEWLAR